MAPPPTRSPNDYYHDNLVRFCILLIIILVFVLFFFLRRKSCESSIPGYFLNQLLSSQVAANPVCEELNYVSSVRRIARALDFLDGESLR